MDSRGIRGSGFVLMVLDFRVFRVWGLGFGISGLPGCWVLLTLGLEEPGRPDAFLGFPSGTYVKADFYYTPTGLAEVAGVAFRVMRAEG